MSDLARRQNQRELKEWSILRNKYVSLSVAILIATSIFAGAPYAANAAVDGPVICSGGGTFTIDTDVVVSSANCVGVATIPSGVSVSGSAFASSPGLIEINFAEFVLGSPWAASASVTVSGQVNCSGSGWFKIVQNEVQGRFDCTGAVNIPVGVNAIRREAFDAHGDYQGLGDPNTGRVSGSTVITNITALTIPNTVTSIGDFAFRNLRADEVVIPDSVTTLGEYAFDGSTMTSLAIGNGLSSIPVFAFANYGTLETLTLGTGLRAIEGFAFFGAGSLTGLTIPDGVVSIGAEAFSGASNTLTPNYCGNADLTNTGLQNADITNCVPAPPLNLIATPADGGASISFDPGATFGQTDIRHEYSLNNGASYSSGNSSSPISLSGLTNGNSYTISIRAVSDNRGPGTPSQISFIAGSSAYTDAVIAGVVAPVAGAIPDSSVTSANGYTGTVAWAGNPATFQPASHYSATITLAPDQGYYFTGVSANFFTVAGATTDTNPANSAVITATFPATGGDGDISCSIGGNTILVNYEITGTDNCDGSIEIPNAVTSIAADAFVNATSITSVTFAPESTLTNIGDRAFQNSAIQSISLPSSLTYIGESAFRGTTDLETIAIPSGVTYLGPSAFEDATSLETISIPDGLGIIRAFTFRGATALTSITFGAQSQLTSFYEEVFSGAISLRTIHIPASVTGFSEGVFLNATALTTVTFADNSLLSGFGNDVFKGASSLSEIEIPNPTEFGEWLFYGTHPSLFRSSYVNWQSPLPANSNAPRIGEKVFASAFEKPLTITGLNSYQEEYVYRITSLENVATSSVDRQSIDSPYVSLRKDQQNQWYEDMGFDPVDAPDDNPYRFSWRAFMCVAGNGDLTPATSLSMSYASRGSVPQGTSPENHYFAFRGVTEDLHIGTSPSTRTVVGTVGFSGDLNSDRGPDINLGSTSPYSLGISEVHSSCGPGKTLEALEVLQPTGTDPITSKEFEITASVKLKRGMQYFPVSSAGLTIGVTGLPTFDGSFNAALWGLTTIASVNRLSGDDSSSGANPAPSPTPNKPNVTTSSKTKSAVLSGFGGDSSKAPASIRSGLRKLVSGFKVVNSVQCTGYTSGRAPSRWDTLLANRRAKVACDLVKQRHPSAKVKVIEKPAVGVGSKFRSVRIKIVGF